MSENETPPEPPGVALRLILGSLLEGSDELWRYVQEAAHKTRAALPTAPPPGPDEDTADRWRYLLLGLLFEAEESVRQAASATPGRLEATARRASASLNRLARPLLDNPLMALAQAQGQRLADNPWLKVAGEQAAQTRRAWQDRLEQVQLVGEALVEGWIARGRYEERFGRTLSRQLAGRPINEIVDYLAENPHVYKLVEEQLERLRENPEPVRELVQNQSVSMAAEAVDELREQGVTADNLIEGFVRRVLRRPPRPDLPPPPLAVRLRAERLNAIGQDDS